MRPTQAGQIASRSVHCLDGVRRTKDPHRLGEIARERPGCDGTSQPRRFQRVLSAAGRNQAASEQRNRRDAIPHSELVQRIGDPDLTRLRRFPGRPQRTSRQTGDAGASFRMPRHQDGDKLRDGDAQQGMRGQDDLVLAGMQAGRHPGRTTPRERPWPRSAQRPEAGRGGAANLRLPDAVTGAPERTDRRSASWALCASISAKLRSRSRARPGARRHAPETAIRHAGIDQGERDLAPRVLPR